MAKHCHRLPRKPSVHGDIQNSIGCGPEQPALNNPALSRSWSKQSPEVPAKLSSSVILRLITVEY